MARKNKSDYEDYEKSPRKKKIEESRKNKKGLKEETMMAIYGIGCIVLALFFTLAYFNNGDGFNAAGKAGMYTYSIIHFLFGVGYALLPLALIMLSIAFFKSIKQSFSVLQVIGFIIFMCSGLGLIDTFFKDTAGLIGKLVSVPLIKAFDVYATVAFLFAFVVVSVLVIFDTHLRLPSTLAFWRREKEGEDDEEGSDVVVKDGDKEMIEEKPIVVPEVKEERPVEENKKLGTFKKESDMPLMPQSRKITLTTYTPPPLSLLERDKGKPGVGDIKANANIIKRTLQNFGINVEMDEISIGPSVTRYALKPAEGMKLSRIVTLQNDLALALAAHPLRIEAPIPGKSLVGIEIPNTTKTTVGLATLLSEDEYANSDKPLLVSLGKGISGKSHFANLAKAPHLLIAGATGSGKSVTIHAILTSLLYRNSPDQLKFIMIDPKRVELTMYNGIAHLLTPVITDAKKAIMALRWAAKEMDRRYDLLETKKVRDIESYHKNVVIPALERAKKKGEEEIPEEDSPETMPYIVVIIDELADIMQAYPRELESGIVRLAQMSRAVGIHLILSTQRPSVNVITGLIKANVPSRIALQVTSQIDSRTILDMAGAEKLLGAGDMLFMSGEMSKPARIQSAYITEQELKRVVKHITDNWVDGVPSEINLSPEAVEDKNAIFTSSFDDGGGEEDELYEEAKETVISMGKASTSLLQRKLSIGYARAARLIDMLEEKGVIGHGEGAKPREILVSRQEQAPPQA